tara:strand:+ start:578 stop:835 length:258 start_codon:yes stop_codon:yes gene_type:complete
MTRVFNRDRRRNLQDADWIVGWIKDHGPATIRDIVAAMKEENRDIKAHTIKRALTKSQFVFKSDEINVDGERHSLYKFKETIFDD